MSATLCLHRGSRPATAAELSEIPTPSPEGRWHPVSHATVLDLTRQRLAEAGYEPADERLALSADNRRFFGTLTCTSPLAPGVSLAVGVRNSHDKSLCLGWCAGSRVFVCDNLAFSAELTVRRRHTTFGLPDFGKRVSQAVAALSGFREQEAARIERMKAQELSDDQALAWVVRAVERKVLPLKHLPRVVKEWRTPSYDYGSDRPTAWLLFQAFTTVLRKRAADNPFDHAAVTVRLSDMLRPAGTAALAA